MKNLKVLAALSVTTLLLVGSPISHASCGAYAFNADEFSHIAPALMHYSWDMLCNWCVSP